MRRARRSWRGALAATSALLTLGCASAPSPSPSPSPGPTPAAATPDDDDEEEGPPRTWGEARERLAFTCPAPPFVLDAPRRVQAGAHLVVVKGSEAHMPLAPPGGALTLGVLGAPKDASEATLENLARAAALFAARGVQLVVVNGDVGEDKDLPAALSALGETFAVPVLVHAGNMEWTRTFTAAMAEVEERHPHVLNGNWVSRLDVGDAFTLLVLPGYHHLRFLRAGACRYTDDDLARLSAQARRLDDEGRVVVLSSHGPPRQVSAGGLDLAYDEAGHVGDERLTRLLEEGSVRFGLFGHILEAGGRATADPAGKEPLKMPVKRPAPSLYVNAGSASSFPWQLLDGSSSSGMALVVTISAEGATAERLRLR